MGIETVNFGTALTKAGAPTSGVAQQETATVVGTITGDGNATVVVTAAGMTGSPATISVPVLNGDTASVVGGKIRTVLAANATIAAFFTVGGTTTAVRLTAITAAANDGTMNISVDNGTCTGLTTAATSANTTAGVKGDYHGIASGQLIIDTTNKAIYQNTGDYLVQTWTLLT